MRTTGLGTAREAQIMLPAHVGGDELYDWDPELIILIRISHRAVELAIRHRHAVLLVPARLPVLLLARGAAVEGHLAAAAHAVGLTVGNFGCAAVGAVAEGGCGACR